MRVKRKITRASNLKKNLTCLMVFSRYNRTNMHSNTKYLHKKKQQLIVNYEKCILIDK